MDTTQNFNMENNTLNQNFVINPMLFQHQTNINMNANNNLMNQNLLYNQMIQNMNNINQMNQNQNFNLMNQNIIPNNQNFNQINQNQKFNQMNQNMIPNNQNFNQMNQSQNVNINMNFVSQIYNNNMNMNINNFWININQISLLLAIIDFYHKTENEFVDINDKYQIMNIMNRLNPNLSTLKQDNEILDPLHYINKPKKVVKFVNSDFKLFNVKIPTFIDKIDLYSIASLYKSLEISDILLISNNCIIKEDESSLDFISEGDLIIIIENRIYPDDSYYKSLLINNNNSEIKNFIWKNSYGISLQFPSKITISQMKKAIYLKFGYHCKEIICEWFSRRNDETLKGIPSNSLLFYGQANQNLNTKINLLGKKIEIRIKIKNQQLIIILGTLDSNQYLVRRIEAYLQEKIKIIYFNEKELLLNIKDEMSIDSLGLKDGSVLMVITEEKEN